MAKSFIPSGALPYYHGALIFPIPGSKRKSLMPDQAASSALTLDVQRCSPEVVVILCHGKLISGTGNILYSQVCKVLPGTKKITLDLCDVNYMDSMGLGTLVRIYVSTKSAGCELILKNLGKRVRELLGLAHLLNVFTVIGEQGIKIGF